MEQVPDAFVRIDIPAECGLGDWLEQAGLKCVDTVARMAKGTPPKASGDVHLFALITQAVG
ncbi:hypothetical protein AO260_19455 [Pseudomonas sp. ABAC21]|nr:hypothetical protein AO260_19455 [Pseudomonas sp. ABAC21]